MPTHKRTVSEFNNETMHLSMLADTIFNDVLVEHSMSVPQDYPPLVNVNTTTMENEDDESPTDANVEKLLEQLTEYTSNGITDLDTCNDVITDAIRLLRDLRHKKAGLIKKERRADALENPRERVKYRTNVPTAAMLFCNDHRAAAGAWYDNGGRIEGVRESRPSQIQRRLANQWKFADQSVRMQYKKKVAALLNASSTATVNDDVPDDDVIVD